MTNELYQNAELSLAAYATFVLNPTGESNTSSRENINALRATRMSGAQADEFVLRYPTIVTQYHDNTSDFDVAAFKDAAGNITVAFRGTTIPEDLPTGAYIVGAGAAYDQIVAMANWWLRVSSPQGSSVAQYRLATYQPGAAPEGAVVLREDGISVWVLEDAPRQAASGALMVALGADSDGKVDVTGHSLGGHLSMTFSSLFASHTGQVTVFNAPGFIDSAVNRSFFAKLGGSIPSAGSNIINVAADEALADSNPFNWIAGMHSRPGTQIDIAIEKQTNSDEPDPVFAALNHSIVALTDSLSVYKLLADLDPALSAENYKAILNQAVQGTAAGYERIVDSLQQLFGVEPELLPVGNNSREALYQAIYALQSNTLYQVRAGTLQIVPAADNAAALLTSAQSGTDAVAYRYALNALAPFAALGDETLYLSHNANGELDLYDASAGSGTLTTAWLNDRAAFLERKLYVSARDLDRYYQGPTSDPGTFPNSPEARGRAYQLEARDYQDRESGFVVSTGGDRDSLQRFVFGSRTVDVITGADREDRLYGSGGTDLLWGGKGDDHLIAVADFERRSDRERVTRQGPARNEMSTDKQNMWRTLP
jgi:hypothetical protein